MPLIWNNFTGVRRNIRPPSSGPKGKQSKQALRRKQRSSKTSVNYQTTRHHIPRDSTLHSVITSYLRVHKTIMTTSKHQNGNTHARIRGVKASRAPMRRLPRPGWTDPNQLNKSHFPHSSSSETFMFLKHIGNNKHHLQQYTTLCILPTGSIYTFWKFLQQSTIFP
jgi:hypothetical protein